ncbi:bifunctional 5,10-methylenetetrahydrofolate dehydrogenase/5,10-methenyltetrahydrofolate cyclohydrolase [Candidatus Kaiserbacteria bacterium]|nr:MAG: bifunctional 5,10-methylenetetrahydrofolate dehydrogenase/5,10-methenyltetrahydrofolate cyclohydrolase [Candidatus Kaiserbacteria bacterium]
MNMIVDGRAIAQKIKESLKNEVLDLSEPVELSIIVVGDNSVTDTFVSAKERFAKDIAVTFTKKIFAKDATTEELISYIEEVSKSVHGVVVQLPLPMHIATDEVLAAIPIDKDIDLLNSATFERFVSNKGSFIPPVAGAVLAILDEYNVSVANKKVAVIGKGKLVGLPVQKVLETRGGEVIVLDTKTDSTDFKKILSEADIIVSGAGVPNLIQPDMVKKGVVLIDAGTSSTGGSVTGDIANECVENALVFSKTPGGVGPLTVAILFENLLAASQ